jgi:hypothetical protein
MGSGFWLEEEIENCCLKLLNVGWGGDNVLSVVYNGLAHVYIGLDGKWR